MANAPGITARPAGQSGTEFLLVTKLALPPARPHLVPRPRLIEQLNVGLSGKLSLIVAPPGFGKTTLLTSWLAARAEEMKAAEQRLDLHPSSFYLHPLQVAWVALDDADNDPTRFWSYVITALDRLYPGAGDHALSMLHSPQPPALEVVVSALLNELAGQQPEVNDGRLTSEPGHSPAFILILDDYHAITARPIHDTMAFLLDHMPPSLHLLIASRTEPPLPLARLRVRGQLTELHAADLRFTAGEAAEFLTTVMGLELSARDVAALETRTEGWIAALHLAALSLRGRNDVRRFINEFAGSNRYLVDYLAEEVLRRQPVEIQTFLLYTSVLDQLCGELCDAVLETTNDEPFEQAQGRRGTMKDATRSEADLPLLPSASSGLAAHRSSFMLEALEHTNLFLIPLDNGRRWYRYHHLFAEFLRERLRQVAPQRMAELHRRASTWYEQHGFVTEAISHALAGGDAEHAARLVEQAARPMLLRSEAATVLGWLRALSPVIVQTRPELCIIWAWALAVTGHFDQIEQHLQDAERAMALEPCDDDNSPSALYAPYTRRNFQSEVVAIRATVAGLRRDLPTAIRLARQALAVLPTDSVHVRAVVALMLGTASYLSGDMAVASQALHEAINAGRVGDNIIILMFAQRQLGELQMRQGQLRQAARTFQQALDDAAARYPPREYRANRPIPVAGTAYMGMGLVLYEWNNLETAARHLADSIELGNQGENIEILLMGPIWLARVQQAQGDAARADETMRQAVQLAHKTGVARLIDWLHAEQARLWLIQRRLDDAVAWAQSPDYQGRLYSVDDEPDYLREIDYLALVQTRIAEGRPAETLPLLERLLHMAEAQGRMGSAIELLALRAIALHGARRSAESAPALERALVLAEPEGYIRTFVDLGRPMAELLQRVAMRDGRLQSYAVKLLAAFPFESEHIAAQSPIVHLQSQLVEPLSERELDVLRLVAAGLSNQEIADKLVVGLSTVKKHINNAYAKLDVKSRTQALVRLRELGLV